MDIIDLCERGFIPDILARAGMRRLVAQRLVDEFSHDGEMRSQRFNHFIDDLRSSPIAINTDDANEQHYEVPSAFFHGHLGSHLKYSCCLYPRGNETLDEAEGLMLELYAERAKLQDGMRILDLGCGWGSLSLWLAQRYPNAEIVGLSNSHGQREFILNQAKARGLNNLRIYTGSIVEFEMPDEEAPFDRALSIEMFEHMKNYGALLQKLRPWLKDDGRLFVHIFVHKLLVYHFEDKGREDWMTRYFFSGGTMPSENLLYHFQQDFTIDRHWWVSGQHYEKTANQWLEKLDSHRSELMPVLKQCYGSDAGIWFQRWRMFYMAVAELFGFAEGNEWGVGHYLFAPR